MKLKKEGYKVSEIEAWEIRGGVLEYLDDTHTYIYEGIVLPSITTIMKLRFGNKYEFVSKEILEKAAAAGTAVHKAIEIYETEGKEAEIKELRNYKFLKNQYKFKCIANEVPVVLFIDEEPVAAGRLDLVIETEEGLGLGDIKRTATLDKEYLAYQLNLYKIAYEQCYGKEIKHLKGLHLREDTRRYINIPVNKEMALNLIYEHLNA